MDIVIGNITGLDQIEKRLKLLDEKTRAKSLRRGLKKAGDVWKKDIKSRVGKDTGALDRSIITKVVVKKSKQIAYALVGVDTRVQATYPSGRVRKPSRYIYPVEHKTKVFDTSFPANLQAAKDAFYEDINKAFVAAGVQNITLP